MLASISMPNDFFNGFFVIRVATLLASLGPFYVLLSSIGFPLNPAPYALFRSIPFSLFLPLALFRSVLLSRSQSVIVYLFVLSTFGRHKRVFEVVYGYARFSIESFRWFPL